MYDEKFEASRFTACRFDARTQELRLVLTARSGAPLRGFAALSSALGPEKDKVLFAMNAGMFDTAGWPVGLYVENGSERRAINRSGGDGNFYMQPNGVFSLDETGMRHTSTGAYDGDRKPLWATQSGPMLLMGGKLTPNISEDGPSRYIRNAVCVLAPQNAVFVISGDAVSFGPARALPARPAGLPRTRSISTVRYRGAWIPSQGRIDDPAPLGPMIVILRK